MAEMILPGTYIEVRAEKLIAPGPISIGNVGIVGTARRGRLNTVYTPSDIGEVRDIFGQYNGFTGAATDLTLVRALELLYGNGAQRVFTVRVAPAGAAPGGAQSAVFAFAAGTGSVVATSVGPGTGYNAQIDGEPNAELSVGPGSDADHRNVTLQVGRVVESWRDVPAVAAAFAEVLNGANATYRYALLSSTGGGSSLFTFDATGATGNVTEGVAAQGSNGTDGAAATAANYSGGLDALLNADVHIIVLAGVGGADMRTELVDHVENASTDLMKRERIAVLGSSGPADVTAPGQDDGRLVFVRPGVRATDSVLGRQVTLPATYAAAAVAGRLSALDPHASPTNKTLNVSALETDFNGTQLEQMILGRVMVLENRRGSIRIVKGITTSENTAWAQVTTRRIVDYARFGVRAAANPFIGRLNNERVRQALKGSINGFLADMVDREMLISYELEVTATREQQIRGIAQVTMILRPTFSIDYVRVVMYLE